MIRLKTLGAEYATYFHVCRLVHMRTYIVYSNFGIEKHIVLFGGLGRQWKVDRKYITIHTYVHGSNTVSV